MVTADTETGIYKHGVAWRKNGNEYMLEQNPNSGSVFAYAARRGKDIQWVMLAKPEIGNLQYQGDVIIDGVRMSMADGMKACLQQKS